MEDVLDESLRFPGLLTLVCRQAHTSIINTTKRTFMQQVLPPSLREHCHEKKSGGEDFVRLPNGSTVFFVGLDDPVRWFSAEVGKLVFDEAHEIKETDVLTLITRLRQPGMLHRTSIAFNPGNPGHWLQKWFIQGASPSEFGYYKRELWTEDATAPIGDAEFIVAKAKDNTHLEPGYVEKRLAGLPKFMRRRYLEGLWEFTEGNLYFDGEALMEYQKRIAQVKPFRVGETCIRENGKADVRARNDGPLTVWSPPVRTRHDREKGELPPHRYVIGVDVSSGGSYDYSGIQVIDVDTFEQVAEMQVKLDPDLVAIEAFRLGCIYNGALIAPEITGGWGHSVVKALEKLLAKHRTLPKPRIYMRRVEDRLTKRFTDKLGWDTTVASRAVMLDKLEEVIREQEFGLRGLATLNELMTFVRDEKGRPAAQPGCNDDLVISLAIAVTLAANMPRQLRRVTEREAKPQFAATGW